MKRWAITSPTQIKTLRRCPRRWWHEKINPDAPKSETTPAQVEGTFTHGVLEQRLLRGAFAWSLLQDPVGVVAPKVLASLKSDAEREAFALITPARLGALVSLASHAEPHLPVAPIRQDQSEFDVRFPVVEGVQVFGRGDFRDHHGDIHRITDFKTTSDWAWMPTEDELREDPQTLVYSQGFFRTATASRVAIRYLYLNKTRPGARVVEFVQSQDEHAPRWSRLVADVERQRALSRVTSADAVPMNERACDDYGGCPFKNLCHTSNTNPFRAGLLRASESNVGLLKQSSFLPPAAPPAAPVVPPVVQVVPQAMPMQAAPPAAPVVPQAMPMQAAEPIKSPGVEARERTQEALNLAHRIFVATGINPTRTGDLELDVSSLREEWWKLQRTNPEAARKVLDGEKTRAALVDRLVREGGCDVADLGRRSNDELAFMASQLDDPINPPDGTRHNVVGELEGASKKDVNLPNGEPVAKAKLGELVEFLAQALGSDATTVQTARKGLGWQVSDLRACAVRVITQGPEAAGVFSAPATPEVEATPVEEPKPEPWEEPAAWLREMGCPASEILRLIRQANTLPGGLSPMDAMREVWAERCKVLSTPPDEVAPVVAEVVKPYIAPVVEEAPLPLVCIDCIPSDHATPLERFLAPWIQEVESAADGAHYATIAYAQGPARVANALLRDLRDGVVERIPSPLTVSSCSPLMAAVEVLIRAGSPTVRGVA